MPDRNLSMERLNSLTSTIIDAAIRIHRTVGPGVLEKAYFECLSFELSSSAGMRIETQKTLPKALGGLAPIHSRQLLTYLRIADCPLGLLLDFGCPTMRAGIKRVINGYYGHSEHSTGAGRRPAPVKCLCDLCELCVEKTPWPPPPQCPAIAAAPSLTT
jgi:hypothetical protein